MESLALIVVLIPVIAIGGYFLLRAIAETAVDTISGLILWRRNRHGGDPEPAPIVLQADPATRKRARSARLRPPRVGALATHFVGQPMPSPSNAAPRSHADYAQGLDR